MKTNLFMTLPDRTATRRITEWGLLALLSMVGFILIWIVTTAPLDPVRQAELAVVTGVIFFICNYFTGRKMTIFLVVLSIVVSLRYLVWRVTDTLEFGTVLQGVMGISLAAAEAYAITVLMFGYFQTVWPLERRPKPLPLSPAEWPTVDIYIPTYNESLRVVRPTVLAAMAIDWPPDKLRIYILDDGRRADFREFARSCGIGYITRPDNAHAKAGNLNHAMRQTDGEFIAVFDCDHIPTRAFLQMTMGWMVHDPLMAVVQTPHHFYSPDPFQRNLAAGMRLPAENNMFYGLVQDGNDFWNASFFCGSCAVLRRQALMEIGGFAQETVTEDAHTALRLHRKGWHSSYLKLPLAAGLATERLILHITQRIRWARGMIQILRLDNPLFGPGLTPAQRICYLNAMAHFLFAIPRVVFLSAPLAYLLLGQNIIAASPLAIVAYAFPHIFHSVATNSRIHRNWRHAFWSEIYETVLALFLVRVTLVTLLSPTRGKFNVTEKGGMLDNGYFDLRAVYPNLLMAGILIIGLGRGLVSLLFQHNDTLTFQALLLNTIWVTFSLLIVLAALSVGRESRQIRADARVRARLPTVIWLPDGHTAQCHSKDLSLGGARLALERPDHAAELGMIDVEFTVGGSRLVIPARITRWSGRILQVRWQPSNRAEESRIVQAVFSRADAWAGWSNFPPDRPLVSLWHVLVSIRGLFRRPNQPFPELEPDPMPAPAGGPAKAALGRVAERFRRPRPMRTVALLILLLGLPATGRAQVGGGAPARPSPAASPASPMAGQLPGTTSAPPAAAPIIRLAPSPATPPTTPPAFQILPPASPPAPESAATPATPPAEGGPQMETRQIVYSLRDLRAQGPMTMRGATPLQGVVFGVRNDEVVTDAKLTLTGALSPAMIPELSNVTVTLNEQYVGTIQANREHPEFGPLEMRPDAVFFQEQNRLNFRFTGRYAVECNDPLSGLLWATVSDTSTLTLTVTRLPPRRNLVRLPLPFFDYNLQQELTLPFVLSARPGNETLQAAAIVSSWFGQVADYRGASFPVVADAPVDGNAVVIAVGQDAPAGLPLPPITGPTLAEIANPNDPFSTLLIVAGRTGAEAVIAATALTLGNRTLSGEQMTVQAPLVPARHPYDAPAWVPTDRPVRFGELVDVAALQGVGYVPGTFHVPFRVSPDLYTWRGRPFNSDVTFRAPPGPIMDVAASRLDVGINGLYLRSFSLAPTDRPLDWMLRLFGYNTQLFFGNIRIPPYVVYGHNDLQLYFDARPLHRGDCAAIPDDLHMSVDPDSTLDLSRAHHFTSLPNLAFFESAGFPFTRLADLSETIAILPDRASAVEISAFLGLMGRFGSLTGYPVIRLTVARPSGVDTAAEKDLLLIGTLSHLADASALLRNSPYKLNGDRLAVELPSALDSVWRLFGDQTGEERRHAAAALHTVLGSDGAALIGAPSPFGHARSLVAILAGSPQGLDAMVGSMRDAKISSGIRGDLTLLAAGQVTSYRTGNTYTVGHLPFWLWPEWLLRDQPLWIVCLILLATFILGALLYRVLASHASRRVLRRTRST